MAAAQHLTVHSESDMTMCLSFSAFFGAILIRDFPVPVLTQTQDDLGVEPFFHPPGEFRILRKGEPDRHATHPHFL